MTDESIRRRCRAARRGWERLDGDVLGPDELSGGGRWSLRRRLLARHLARCESCAAAWTTHQRLAAGLADVVPAPSVDVTDDADSAPPDGLLEGLLAQAADPGIRGRAAVPIRGAVSGARPGLTVGLLLFAGLVGAMAAYGTWRATRVLRRG